MFHFPGFRSSGCEVARMSNPAFWSAVRAGDVDTVRNLLKEDPSLVSATCPGDARALDPEAESKFTSTAVHHAVVHDRLDLLEALWQGGADLNAIGFEAGVGLAPPVVMACAEASCELLAFLLEHGADPNLPGSAETALYTAIEKQYQDKIELLLSKGARHDVFTACMIGDTELAVYFLEAYPSLLQARSLKRNRTPWEEAATHEQDDVMAAVRAWTERGKEEQAAEQSQDHWGGGEQETFWGGSDDGEPADTALGGESAVAVDEPEEQAPVEATPEPKPEPTATPRPAESSADWEQWADPDSSWPG